MSTGASPRRSRRSTRRTSASRVEAIYAENRYWPEPLIQINPSYKRTTGCRFAGCERRAARGLRRDYSAPMGEPLSLYKHQEEAVALAADGESFVVTTGTGSGKSLCFFIPIVNQVLAARRTGAQRRTQAIVVYPMNALANSQMDELRKFISQVSGEPPITFARYTGQEDQEERRRVADHPPDILLTNFMMLELLMTRQEELDRRVIGNCAGLQFLVLDEIHTYRGRQGADVALLVRRVRERLQPENLLCIGTSATMASEGSQKDKGRVVAGVASKLFGVPIAESNVIAETLERTTDSTATADSVRPELGGAIDAGVPHDISDAALREHPLAVWVETRLGILFSQGEPTLVTRQAVDRDRSGGPARRRNPVGPRPPAARRCAIFCLCRAFPSGYAPRILPRARTVSTRSSCTIHLRRRPRLHDDRAARHPHRDGGWPVVPSRPRGEAPVPRPLLPRVRPRVPPGAARARGW